MSAASRCRFLMPKMDWTNIQFCETILLREKYVRTNRKGSAIGRAFSFGKSADRSLCQTARGCRPAATLIRHCVLGRLVRRHPSKVFQVRSIRTGRSRIQGLAQLAEFRVWGAAVAGSSPATLTRFAAVAQLAEHRPCKSVVAGSNPCQQHRECSSVGRAPALQAGCRGFEALHFHQHRNTSSQDRELRETRSATAQSHAHSSSALWSSPIARLVHTQEVAGLNPASATT